MYFTVFLLPRFAQLHTSRQSSNVPLSRNDRVYAGCSCGPCRLESRLSRDQLKASLAHWHSASENARRPSEHPLPGHRTTHLQSH
jgi:hypothetical protein